MNSKAREWYLHSGGQTLGPVTVSQLERALDLGKITPESIVSKGEDSPRIQLKELLTPTFDLAEVPERHAPSRWPMLALAGAVFALTAVAALGLVVQGRPAAVNVADQQLELDRQRLALERERLDLERLRLAQNDVPAGVEPDPPAEFAPQPAFGPQPAPASPPAPVFQTVAQPQAPRQFPVASARPAQVTQEASRNAAAAAKIQQLRVELDRIGREGQELYDKGATIHQEATGVYTQGTTVSSQIANVQARVRTLQHGVQIRMQTLRPGPMVVPDGLSAPYNAYGVQILQRELLVLEQELAGLTKEARELENQWARLQAAGNTWRAQYQAKLNAYEVKRQELAAAESAVP